MSTGDVMGKETYIGDGVYASFDGWHIWLRTEREDGTHRIALEPQVFAGLFEYAARIERFAGPELGAAWAKYLELRGAPA